MLLDNSKTVNIIKIFQLRNIDRTLKASVDVLIEMQFECW